MKTNNIIKTVLIASMLVIVSVAQAGSLPPQQKKADLSTKKTVQRYFKFPSLLITPFTGEAREVEKVEVLFTTDVNGKVNFVIARTDNAELKAEIEKQFYKMPFKEGNENVVQKVILNFRIA
jgi:hypothetical protein